MTFLESLKMIRVWKADEVPLQHLLRALHTGFAEVTPHVQVNADRTVVLEVYLVDLTASGREFIRTVDEAIKE